MNRLLRISAVFTEGFPFLVAYLPKCSRKAVSPLRSGGSELPVLPDGLPGLQAFW